MHTESKSTVHACVCSLYSKIKSYWAFTETFTQTLKSLHNFGFGSSSHCFSFRRFSNRFPGERTSLLRIQADSNSECHFFFFFVFFFLSFFRVLGVIRLSRKFSSWTSFLCTFSIFINLKQSIIRAIRLRYDVNSLCSHTCNGNDIQVFPVILRCWPNERFSF